MSADFSYWRRNLAVLWVSQFVSLCGFSMSVPFAAYFIRELAPDAGEPRIRFYAGLSSLLTQAAFMVAAPLWGWVADRFGRKKMALRAAFMGTVVLGLMGLSRSVWQFLALRFFQGCFTGTIAASTTLVACNTPREKQGFALGLLSSSIFSGEMAGLLVGGVLADQFGFRNSFHISSGLLLVTTLLVLFLVKEQFTPEAGDAAGKPTGAGGWRLTWTTVLLPALPVLAIYGCNSLARLMDQSQIALYVEQLNGGVDFPGREMFTSWVMGAGSLGAVTAGFLLARHIDGRPARIAQAMALTACLAVLAMAALPFVLPSEPRVSLPGVAVGTTWGVLAMIPLRFIMVFCGGGMEPICTSWISKVTEPEHRGVIFGYAQAVRSSCSGLGHLGACIIAPALGVNALYWTIPAAFLALAAMVALFRNRIAQRIRCVQSNYITSSGASS